MAALRFIALLYVIIAAVLVLGHVVEGTSADILIYLAAGALAFDTAMMWLMGRRGSR
jgi:hypothetical protein